MTMPHRIQLKRSKGWRMPENTIKVDRSTRYGNPFELHENGGTWSVSGPDFKRSNLSSKAEAIATSVGAYRRWVETGHAPDITALRGKNLACWCVLDGPCHADTLLELANR
jgi:hypothetical protein